MTQRGRRTVRCNTEQLERARRSKGLSLESLARSAGLHVRTVKRILAGKPAYLETVASIAHALDVRHRDLVDSGQLVQRSAEPSSDTAYELNRKLVGFFQPGQGSDLLDVARKAIQSLEDAGVSVASTVQSTHIDEAARVIIVFYGHLHSDPDQPYWVYAAVRRSQYDAFSTAHKNGTVDVYDFDNFGEIIVSGPGTEPPPEITNKVAELYGCSDRTKANDQGNRPPSGFSQPRLLE